MGEFYESCRGLGDMARQLGLPFLSGNVSFYNESIKTAVPPTPEIMGIGIIDDIRKSVTSDFKDIGNLIYLVGKTTEKEMGGSEYYDILGIHGGNVPRTDSKILRNCIDGILSSIEKKYIVYAQTIGAHMCFIIQYADRNFKINDFLKFNYFLNTIKRSYFI